MERIFNTIYTEKPFSFFPIFFLLTIYHDLLIQVSWEQNILNVKIKRCTLMLCKVKKKWDMLARWGTWTRDPQIKSLMLYRLS